MKAKERLGLESDLETRPALRIGFGRRGFHAYCGGCGFRGQTWYDYGLAEEDRDAHRDHCDRHSSQVLAI